VDFGETPEQAAERELTEEIGVSVPLAFDHHYSYVNGERHAIGICFVATDDANGLEPVIVADDHSSYEWVGITALNDYDISNETKQILQGVIKMNINDPDIKLSQALPSSAEDTVNPPPNKLKLYADGGSRGNPGPSASGFVIMNAKEEVVHQGGLYLGITTNNQAEYHGVRLGLEKALEMGAKTVDFRMDSLLVVNQLTGVYKIKNRDLWPIHERIKELATQFEKVTYMHVRREFNQLADGMVNKILNAHEEQNTPR
jgi:ribonuclease HI